MQLNPQPCCRKNGGLMGLGFWEAAAAAVASNLLTQNSGGGSTPSAAPATSGGSSVNPSIAVSPQISPSFVQQWQPSNSAVTTGAAQIGSGGASSSPAPTGQGAGYGYGSSYPQNPLPMSVDAAIPTVQTSQQWGSMLTAALPWLIGGAVVIVGIRAFSRRG